MGPAPVEGVANVSAETNPMRAATIGWAFRRTMLCVAILAIAISGMAWLTHASIDAALERAAEAVPAIPVIAR